MIDKPITVGGFKQRLALLCRGKSASFPRRHRGRHIILRSVVQRLDPRSSYSERKLGEYLALWVDESGLEIDHVTLRRCLVDAGCLVRDAGGDAYQAVLDGSDEARFDPAVVAVDPAAIMKHARRDRVRRKHERRHFRE